VSGRLGTATAKPGEASEHGLSLGEVDVCNFEAVAAVPAKRRPLEPCRLRLENQKQELEGVREPDVREVGGRGKRDVRVAAVERTTKAAVGGTLRSHEQMFSRCGLGV
jgi:hypothetical protein